MFTCETQAFIAHHSVLQQVLQACGRRGAITAVLLFHVLLHLLHLILSLFYIREELQGTDTIVIRNTIVNSQMSDDSGNGPRTW